MDVVRTLWDLLSNPALMKYLFGSSSPPWLARILQPVIILLILSYIISAIWKNLKEPIKSLIEMWRRHRATGSERERIQAWQQFAAYIQRQIEGLDEADRWEARRFAELEADYYANNRGGARRWRRLFSPLAFGPRRVRRVLQSLLRSREQFALIEGDPGSGKSVLLRKLAWRICSEAAVSWKRTTRIALYLNLKMLERHPGESIDQDLIRRFVKLRLKQAANPGIQRFVDEHFDSILKAGRFLFLFDSFDEIPEVLAAEDVSDTIDQYSKAIFEFATDFNPCRSLLATRYFRRPKDTSFVKYQIAPLSDAQRDQLIERASLPPQARERLYVGIGKAGSNLRYILENPMYLSMLIEYVRDGDEFPTSAYDLFGRFFAKWLGSKENLLQSKYATTPAELLKFSELISYVIVADSSLGLDPARTDLLHAVERVPGAPTPGDRLLDALEHV